MPPVPQPQPLRVLHLNSVLRRGGTDTICVQLAHGLQKFGQNVWVGGPDGRQASTLCRNLGIPLHPIEREGLLKVRFTLSAARFIRRARIQVIHGHHGRDYWRTVAAARLSGVHPRVVLHRHLAKSPGTWLSRNFLLNRTDAFIAASNCVAQIMTQGMYEPKATDLERRVRPPMRGDHRRIRVIHGGVDTDRFQPRDASALRKEWNLSPDDFAFGVVARYGKPRGKGQREFLAAAAELHRQFPRARFLMIGRGDLADVLQADIERLGLSGKAWMTPWCNDMVLGMNAIDCLVHPQIGTDAFPTVILEAMACAKPVIATRLDGAVEQVVPGETGLMVAPEDVPGLAEAMKSMLEGESLRLRFGAAGRRRVCDNFSLPVLAEKVLALYRELCFGSAPTLES
jgi:glycosyltransferase involved in cell wall biosynthesis